MRLRYLRLPKLKPLEDIAVNFGYEPVLGRPCALHFVAGVNGTGKSRLMRAIAEIFLCMERGTPIPFPVTLVYDLGPDIGDAYNESTDRARALSRHTIYLHRSTQEQTVLADFEYITPDLPSQTRDWEALVHSDWDNFNKPDYRLRIYYRGDNLPSSYLPTVLLAYTSGAIREWEELFAQPRTVSQDILVTTFNNLELDQERPPGWDAYKEAETLHQQGISPELEENDENSALSLSAEYESARISGMGVFVSPDALNLAFCAVALDQAQEDFAYMINTEAEENFVSNIRALVSEERRMRGLRGILNEIDWMWPVTIGLHVTLHPERLPQIQMLQLNQLYHAATTVIREPEPGFGRHLYFDLRAMQKDEDGKDINTAGALIRALTPIGIDRPTRFGIFKQLLILRELGILEGITIALRKLSVDDLLIYDWLSDGERGFLGRMAFFHLLQGTDDAMILLDEAETHFNDYWKREMVDIIDDSLRDNTVEVLLSTHSSIALTDAFDTEIILLTKDLLDGSIRAEKTPIKSFGASPVDIMLGIFHAPQSVGQRAAEFLDLLLIMTHYSDEVEAVWRSEPGALPVLQKLVSQRMPRAFRRDEDPAAQMSKRLLSMLHTVYQYTQQMTGKEEITLADAIETLQQRLGPGYYDFEFRRRAQQLRRDTPHVAPDQSTEL